MLHASAFPARRARAIACVLAVAALAALFAGCAGSVEPPENTIGVNSLTADPQAFSGEIAIEGVVQDVAPDASAVALIDVTEYETCGLTPCGSAGILPLYIPTAAAGLTSPSGAVYAGTMPALEERVVVVGEVREGDGGLYFDVERVFRGSDVLLEKQ